jgi:hypothetical protein
MTLIAFLVPAWFAAPAQSNREQVIKLSENLIAGVPAPWEILRKQTRGLDELVLRESSAENSPVKTYLAISTEWRGDHARALQRLEEIAGERSGAISYMDICGWPAMARRSLVELPQVMREEHVRKLRSSAVIKTTTITIVVAADNVVVRYEATLSPNAHMADADEVLTVAGKLRCSTRPADGQTERELKTLGGKAKPIAEPVPEYLQELTARGAGFRGRTGLKLVEVPPDRRVQTGAGKLTPSQINPPSLGELQIAVSSDSQNVVVATNDGLWFSTDGGGTYNLSAPITWGFSVDGDPSVGVGKSGNFYYSTIGMAGLPAPPAACTDVVAVSQDGGNNFTPTGSGAGNATGAAAFCAASGTSACFPDQEQMAVDRNFASPSGDQLYMVWRNFRPTPGSTSNRCDALGPAPVTPMISCSMDGGKTWVNQTAVGTGDFGRITVGSDGFVYVTYVNGTTLNINKFDQCQNNLAPQTPVFPVSIPMVGGLTGVNCPIPGLDRCGAVSEASPQPSVDDTNPLHVMVAFAQDATANTLGSGNIMVLDSHDGGKTWPRTFVVNSNVPAVRFMPWICTTQGDTYVSWYDRRAADLTDPSLTTYFVTAVDLRGPVNPSTAPSAVGISPEIDVSQAYDPQCASGWPGGADNFNDAQGCPSSTPKLTGTCQSALGGGSLTKCTSNADCKNGESCNSGRGSPKYGDYNGNACMNGKVYVAWASGTPPAGLPSGKTISIYTDRLSSACGGLGQACCTDSSLSVCRGWGFACVSNKCQSCPGNTVPNSDHSACVPPPLAECDHDCQVRGTDFQSCSSICSDTKTVAAKYHVCPQDAGTKAAQCLAECTGHKPEFESLLGCSILQAEAVVRCRAACGENRGSKACQECMKGAADAFNDPRCVPPPGTPLPSCETRGTETSTAPGGGQPGDQSGAAKCIATQDHPCPPLKPPETAPCVGFKGKPCKDEEQKTPSEIPEKPHSPD